MDLSIVAFPPLEILPLMLPEKARALGILYALYALYALLVHSSKTVTEFTSNFLNREF